MNTNQKNKLSWYALAVRSRCEKAVANKLQEQHIEVFLPLINERKTWSDRVKIVENALFPGYLFIHCNLTTELRYQLLESRDALSLVGHSAEHMALAIPDVQIEAVQQIVSHDPEAEAAELFVEGRKVRVINGPMSGIEGVVLQSPDGQHRLYCNLPLLGRSVRTRISKLDVLPIMQ